MKKIQLPIKTIKVKNKFERKIYDQLKGSGASYESTRIPYVLAGHYIPDYTLPTPNGKIFIEAKGYFRPEAKRKMVAVKRQHPELDIRIVFYRYNAKYERWAIKYGFKFAWGDIPKDWLNGL